ncbi:hypothetical protein OG994_16665 [Micromonospora globbae]|uniref:Uncharacterized protein n=1 Tax=Micromonospora globbae TaxID=1894969 RepID=A0ABZ1S0N1_9ACTN|nr:hypothetical protein [Micromonospora globbae]
MLTCYPDTIKALTTQGYRHLPHVHACAHGLTRNRCGACGVLPHRDGCDILGLDHATVAVRHGVRHLFTWLYLDSDEAEVWAADYANRHGLVYRINHPDDLEAYCPGVTSVRYHREGQSCE